MVVLLFLTVREYRDDPCDILGGIYHELNLNNEWNGQYFTPDHICRFMAQITLPSEELSAKDGPITINEPTCGSGTMVIGAIWAMQHHGFDYRHNTFFVAQDIDIRCVWMAYIQLSLYGDPCHGHSWKHPDDGRVGTDSIRRMHWYPFQRRKAKICSLNDFSKNIAEWVFPAPPYFFRKELGNETKENRNDGFSRKRRYYRPVL